MGRRGVASVVYPLCLLLVLMVGARSAAGQDQRTVRAGGESSLKQFGHAVAVTDEWAFVGEPKGRFLIKNSVFVYRKIGGDWVPTDTLTSSQRDEAFGRAIALDGRRAFVGAPESSGAGAVYVFEVDEGSGVWTRAHVLQASSHVMGAEFGTAVDASGELLLVGAPSEAEHGAAYVFERQSEGSWVQSGRLEGVLQDNGLFGFSVAVAGAGVVVGAPDSKNRAGIAYVFTKDEATGAWSVREQLPGSEVDEGNRFARAMAGENDRLVIGSPLHEDGMGAAYVFTYDASSDRWSEADVLRNPNPGAETFGWDVAMAGGRVLAGAVLSGAAHFFRRDEDAETYSFEHTVADPLPEVQGYFAHRVSLFADHALIGTRSAERVYLFEREAADWQLAATFVGGASSLERIEGRRACAGGRAAGYECRQVDLLAFLPVGELGTDPTQELNDIWGWTDPETGTEYALVGRTDGTAFVDLSDPEHPLLVGSLPTQTVASIWRDVKVVNDHAVVVADNAGNHGMQVFDLSQLRDVTDAPVEFEPTAVYEAFGSAHNVAVNDAADHAYVVGITGPQTTPGFSCGPGPHIVDMSDPVNPAFAGCYNPSHGRGYTHDAHCVRYGGPDEDHAGRDICLGADEVGVSITDVTEPAEPVPLGRVGYPDHAYTHQGWLTDDHRYFLVNDELDEWGGLVDRTRTLIFDVQDLEDPVFAGAYLGETSAIDHNLYVDGNLVYEANYTAGLRILVFDSEGELTADGLEEAAFFDVYPRSDELAYLGAWSSYPYFGSGIVVVSGITSGLYVLEPMLAADVASDDPAVEPKSLALRGYPNPASASISIEIDAGRSMRVRVDVFDALGRRARTLHDGPVRAGVVTFVLETDGLPNGTYFVRASSGGGAETASFVLQR